jgi:peptide-methionine (R)-S-oxide reductase
MPTQGTPGFAIEPPPTRGPQTFHSYVALAAVLGATAMFTVLGVVGTEEKKKVYPVQKSDAEWRGELAPESYRCLRQDGTEPPGTSPLLNEYPKTGHFACGGCGFPLYSVSAKFPDSGWPAWDMCFWTDDQCHVGTKFVQPNVYEIHCNECGGHLGHVFLGERHTESNERH